MISSTSISRPQGGSQTVLFGLPTAESNLSPLEGLMQTLTVSEGSVVTEAQRTASKFEQFKVVMKANMTALAEENRALQEQFTALESRQKEMTVLHKEQLAAAQAREETARQEVTAVRREMLAVAQRADERVADALAAQAESVRAATERGEALTATARQETVVVRQELQRVREETVRQAEAAEAAKIAAVQAATQRGEAQVAATRLEVERAQQEANQVKAQYEAKIAYLKDSSMIQECCILYSDFHRGIINAAHTRSEPDLFASSLHNLIDKRKERSLDLVGDVILRRSDTQELEKIVSLTFPMRFYEDVSTWYTGTTALTSKIQAAQAKLAALIAERKSNV